MFKKRRLMRLPVDSAVDQAKHIAQELLGTTQSKAEQAYNAVRGDTSGTTGAAGTGQAKSWRGTLEEYTERAATQVAGKCARCDRR